ncbi:MAG: glycosyltransferase [Anaerolineae bacterium]|nr:glycosyltransferase [Anaerolineae bacterium]
MGTTPHTVNFEPAQVLELELSQPLPALDAVENMAGHRYRKAVILVRLHTVPVGLLDLDLGDVGLSADQLAVLIWHNLHREINAHMKHNALPELTALDASGIVTDHTPRHLEERRRLLANAPMVSIVVPTHNRPDSVARCLETLVALDYPNYEILVVDNGPNSNATELVVKETYGHNPRVRYVFEKYAGVSLARNRGIAEARGEIIAYADDDVLVDKHWLSAIVAGFNADDDIACVTGLIIPAELDTPAQVWFEQIGGFPKRLTRQIYDMGQNKLNSRFYPYSSGVIGVGANMAFKASALRAAGGFHPALGPGTPAVGGEDLDLYFRMLMGGCRFLYEPMAIVRHIHRRDYEELRKQMYNYGVGFFAYLTKCLLDDPRRLFKVLFFIPPGLYQLLSATSVKNAKKQSDYPKELVRLEQKGWLYGPIAYLRSRW